MPADRSAATTLRLTEAQRRHLIELYGDGKQVLYWRPANSGEERCALALRSKGLVGGSFLTYSDGYRLTAQGAAVARDLVEVRDA